MACPDHLSLIVSSEMPNISSTNQYHNHLNLQPVDPNTGLINGGMPSIPSSKSGSVDHRDLTWQRKMISHHLSDATQEKLGNNLEGIRRSGNQSKEESWNDDIEDYSTESSSDHDADQADDEYDHYSQLIGKLSDVDDEDAYDKENLSGSLLGKTYGTSGYGEPNIHKIDGDGTNTLKKINIISHGGHNPIANSKHNSKEKLFHKSRNYHKPSISSQRERPIQRTWSVTDNDMNELRGSIDLGFGFTKSYDDQGCSLKATLPALEFYHTVTKNFLDSKKSSSPISTPRQPNTFTRTTSLTGDSIDTYRISSSGDSPSEVKLRLRHWAQAVACSLKEGSFK